MKYSRTSAMCFLAVACVLSWPIPSRAQQAARKYTLVRDGAPACTLVVPDKPGQAAWFGAIELREHIRLITGAEVPVVSESDPAAGAAGLRILIGASSATAALGIKSGDFKPQEYTIRFLPGAICLVGDDLFVKDKEDKYAYTAFATNCPPPRGIGHNGSLYAVYDFLEKFCDVRWYVPTELGTVFKPRKTLEVTGRDLRRKPGFEYRTLGWEQSIASTNATNATNRELEVFLLRNKVGGASYEITHAFEGWPARFLTPLAADKTGIFEGRRPEYFAMIANTQNAAQLCYSSSQVVAQVVKDARAFFDGKPPTYRACVGENYYGLVPRDNEAWCECKKCRSTLNDKNLKATFTDGYASRLVWSFTDKVAREIAKTHPGAHVAQLAYRDYAGYPGGSKLATNIYIGYAMWNSANWVPNGGEDLKNYQKWIQKCPGQVVMMWLYPALGQEAAGHAGYFCFPQFHARSIAKQLKLYRKDGVRGAFLCGGPQGTLDRYMFMKLFDDPGRDPEALIQEFFNRFYGPVAGPILQKLYGEIEDVYMNVNNYPGKKAWGMSETIAWEHLGSETRMFRWKNMMAEIHAKTKDPLILQRVELFERGVWRFMVRGREQYLSLKENQKDYDEFSKLAPPSIRIPKLSSFSGVDASRVAWTNVPGLAMNRRTTGYLASRQAEVRIAHDGMHLFIQMVDPLDVEEMQDVDTTWGDRLLVTFNDQKVAAGLQVAIVSSAGTTGGTIGKAVQTRDKEGWKVQLSIPLSKMGPKGKKPGDVFYINVFRFSSNGLELLALSPTLVAADTYTAYSRMMTATLAQ